MNVTGSSKSAALRAKLGEWTVRHPVLSILLVSLLAVAVNCYPIVFFGRSYVSPTRGVPMVYGNFPTLPGMADVAPVNGHGSDTGGMMIWGVPIGLMESRSILEHGEIPLWNRYSHAGDTLLGQAVSMLGDPLHWIVILGHGSALAWDLKFLLAKFLFCAGFGLLIRRLFQSLPLALIFCALAAYSGPFYYIFNHPIFFVFCYTPWILLSAIELTDPASKKYLPWGLVWLLANFGCFNAGHIEPAVVFIGGLNLAALAFSIITFRGLAFARKILVRITIGTALFLALTAPFWLSFLAALQGAFTIHSEIRVVQMPFASALGIFDDVFFRLPVHEDGFHVPAPGASFLIFVGAVYSLIRWRLVKDEKFFWVNLGAVFLWGGCVFGWVPAPLLAAVPLLNRVGHTHTDFSYLLVIHLTIQCAYGFRCLAREESFRRAAISLAGVTLVLTAMTLLYCFGFEHAPVPWIYFLPVIGGAFAAPLLFAWLRNRPHFAPIGYLSVLLLAFVPNFRFAFYNFGFDVLMKPGPRVALNAPSPSINHIKADTSEPFRVIGAELILSGDYAAAYGLEDIRSCAPLSNTELVNLLRNFPGMIPNAEWEVDLGNPVLAHSLLNLLNVKYLLTPPAVNVGSGLGFRLVSTNDFGVIENLDTWPRAYFSDTIVPLESNGQFITYLSAHGKSPFAALTPDELAHHPELLPLKDRPNPIAIFATNYTLRANSTAFNIHAPSAGVACLTEGNARDFFATANGEPKSVFTVNRAFKGIYLDKPGDYHIEFVYRPGHWKLACTLFWLACASIVLICIGGFATRKQPKTEMPVDRTVS